MKYLKFRLGELSPGKIGVFADLGRDDIATGACWAVIDETVPRAEEFTGLLLSAPDLLRAAEALLEFVDPIKIGDVEYNMALLGMKRACLNARKELNLESVLFRENFFNEPHEAIATGTPLTPFTVVLPPGVKVNLEKLEETEKKLGLWTILKNLW